MQIDKAQCMSVCLSLTQGLRSSPCPGEPCTHLPSGCSVPTSCAHTYPHTAVSPQAVHTPALTLQSWWAHTGPGTLIGTSGDRLCSQHGGTEQLRLQPADDPGPAGQSRGIRMGRLSRGIRMGDQSSEQQFQETLNPECCPGPGGPWTGHFPINLCVPQQTPRTC